MELNLDDIEIKVRLVDSGTLKAIVAIDFGLFTVKGFRVQTSTFANAYGQNLWLTAPSYKSNQGKYQYIFYMPDKELWHDLEDKIWKAYNKTVEEGNVGWV